MARPIKKKPSDPTKPLDNIKHEIFAQMLVKNKGNKSKSYVDTYGPQIKESAPSMATRLSSKVYIKDRVAHLMALHDVSLEKTIKVLGTQLVAQKALVVDKSIEYVPDNAAIGHAMDTSLKLHGALDDKPLVQNNIQNNTVLLDPARLEGILARLEALEAKRNRPRPSGVVEIEIGDTGGSGRENSAL